ncbi:MAG: hypothetical protein MHMPM18_004728 [Marteilia pararefringens]
MSITVFCRGNEKKHPAIDTATPMNKLNSLMLEEQSLYLCERLPTQLKKINLLCIDRYDFSDTITYVILPPFYLHTFYPNFFTKIIC